VSRRNAVTATLRRTAAPLGAATVVSQLNSILILLALTNLGTLDTLADFRIAISAVAIASIVALPGAAVAVARSVARGQDVAFAIARRRIPWAVVGAAGLAITGAVLAAIGRGSTGFAIAVAGLVFVPWSVSDLAGAYLIGARAFPPYLRLQAVVQTTTVAWVVLAVTVGHGRAWLIVLGYLSLTAVAQAVVLLRLRRTEDRVAVDECHRYGKQLSRIGALSSIDLQLDVLLTAALLSKPNVALLAVARSGGQFMKATWYLVSQANIGRLAALHENESRRESVRLAVALTAVYTLVGVVAAGLCPWVVPFVFGEGYAGAVPVAQLLLLVPAVSATGSCLELHLKAQARVRELYVLHLVKPLTSAVLLPLALVLFGLVGVGIEALVIAVLYTILTLTLVFGNRVRHGAASRASAAVEVHP
jgi:O-antigen/teichoic acid export membrane protein